MDMKKTSLPLQADGDSILIGRGAEAVRARVKNGELVVESGAVNVHQRYPDMWPWDVPHQHPEWDTYKNHACDLWFPPDNIPVAALPMAIRELKRLAIGSWVVNAPVEEELTNGTIVYWDEAANKWLPALAKQDVATTATKTRCSCPVSLLPELDVPVTPTEPEEEEMPCTDFDERLDKSPTQAFQPEVLGVVTGTQSVQTNGVVRSTLFNFPAKTPLYLSATEVGKVTTEDTGTFLGTVLVPGVFLLNTSMQIFEKYFAVVTEELKAKIICEMEQLQKVKASLEGAIADGDAANAEAIAQLNEFITLRLQQLQSFLDSIGRQYEALASQVEDLTTKVDSLENTIEEDAIAGGRGHVVNTIAGRDEYKDAPEGTIVFVRDATADPAVDSGPATYILVGQGADSYWSNITSSISIEDALGDFTTAQLQNAIEKAHAHANKTLLDSITSFGEQGVKIGNVTIINSDGTLAGGGGGGSTEGGDDDTVWVAYLEEAPTDENFDTLLADVPDGGLYTAPLADVPDGGLYTAPLADVPDGGGGEDDEPGVDNEAFTALQEEVNSLKDRVTAEEAISTAITQTVSVTIPGETEEDEPTVTQEKRVAAHQDADGIYGVGTDNLYGHVRVRNNPSATDLSSSDVFAAQTVKELMSGRGQLNWPSGTPTNGYMVDASTFLVTGSGTVTLPAGKFSIEVVGGGGAGGQGGNGATGRSRGGRGGSSSVPTIQQIGLNAAAGATITIGGGGGASSLVCNGITIYSAPGNAGGGSGRGGWSNGDRLMESSTNGAAYVQAGGSGGGQSNGTYSAGGGGGDGSRFSRYNLGGNIRADSGANCSNGAAIGNATGYGGQGGVGYGAGGGGGGVAFTDNTYATANGGAGAPGCVLIVALL